MVDKNGAPSAFDPNEPEFAARRAKAREELSAIDPALSGDSAADPLRRAWFETVYERAQGDPAGVPWANLAPHPLTRTFVEMQLRDLTGLRVLDIGCGLGDNAELFATAGAEVTAFDLVASAIEWAKRRFPDSKVAYSTGDLFALPPAWNGGFDLVHECYTLQALSVPLVPKALSILTSLIAPGGRLLVVARARNEDEDINAPPWPLPPSFFDEATKAGLTLISREDIAATGEVGRRHWRALFKRAEGV
jgi:2-polyprenyl-3-methyl-5-hydroxy-6-metoxy-1,4-benzoquinol methylase